MWWNKEKAERERSYLKKFTKERQCNGKRGQRKAQNFSSLQRKAKKWTPQEKKIKLKSFLLTSWAGVVAEEAESAKWFKMRREPKPYPIHLGKYDSSNPGIPRVKRSTDRFSCCCCCCCWESSRREEMFGENFVRRVLAPNNAEGGFRGIEREGERIQIQIQFIV